MCRHLAYLGPPIAIRDVLYTPPHALAVQARAPEHQVWGDSNPDGFGVGWFPPDGDARFYRTTRPIWDDDEFAARAGTECAGAIVAAARLATPGSPVELAGVAPFRSGPWFFALNGIVEGFNDGVGDELRSRLQPDRRAAIEGNADTEVCFQLLLEHVDAGEPPETAVAALVAEVEAVSDGRLNFLLGDGTCVVATAIGNSLFTRTDPVVISSEALDDDPGWSEVPDRTLVVADHDCVTPTSI